MEKVKIFLGKLPPWILTAVCFLAICWLTLAPQPLPENDIPLFPGADKIAHAIMFGGFTLCIIVDGNRRKGWPVKILKTDIYAPDAAAALGMITELLQWKMDTGRSGDVWDLVADITGAFLVCMICIAIKIKYTPKP